MVLLVVISIMIVTQLKHLKESKDNANYVKQLAHHLLESDELTVLVIFLNRPYQGSYNLQEYKQLHIMNCY